LPLHPVNERLMATNRRRGLRPFRLPLAIDAATCLRCNVCPGYLCPTGARRSSAHLVNEAVAANFPLHVLSGTEAESLIWSGGGEADGMVALDRSTGARRTFRAPRYALAAGAIFSPLLLLRSGVDHPLVGRHYMMHLSPVTDCGSRS
jgi:choline dehydrogenase-like flavoprotein